MGNARHHAAECGEFFGLNQRILGLAQMSQGGLRRVAGIAYLPLSPLALGDLFGGDIDRNDLAAWRAQRMPIGHPVAFLDLVGALSGHFDPGHRLARFHDRAYDRFDGICQRRHAVPDKAANMIFYRDAADLGEALVDLQVAAIRREASEPDRGSVVNQLHGGLLGKQHHLRGPQRFRHVRHATPS